MNRGYSNVLGFIKSNILSLGGASSSFSFSVSFSLFSTKADGPGGFSLGGLFRTSEKLLQMLFASSTTVSVFFSSTIGSIFTVFTGATTGFSK